MNLKQFKKKLQDVSPFLVYKVAGQNGVLCIEDGSGQRIPMSVEVVPPSISFIIESAQITTLILRYSSNYQKNVEKAKEGKTTDLELKTKLAEEIMEEVRENLADDDEQVKMIGVISRLGREFLMKKAVRVWWGDSDEQKKEAVNVIFTSDKEAAEKANEASGDDSLAVWVDLVGDMELVNIGMELMKAIPEGEVPNIPLEDTTVQPDGTTKKGVTSVPADKLARFPRNTRSIVVEDVQEEHSENAGRSRKATPTRS